MGHHKLSVTELNTRLDCDGGMPLTRVVQEPRDYALARPSAPGQTVEVTGGAHAWASRIDPVVSRY